MNFFIHTNCCNRRSLVEHVLGAHILDRLGINSLCRAEEENI